MRIRQPVRATLGGLCLLWAGATAANEASDVDCLERAITRAEIGKCFRHSSAVTARNLASLMKALEAKLENEALLALREIQAQWQMQAIRGCQWESGFFGKGPVRRGVLVRCVETLTGDRIDRLKLFLCEDAGATGPCEASGRY